MKQTKKLIVLSDSESIRGFKPNPSKLINRQAENWSRLVNRPTRKGPMPQISPVSFISPANSKSFQWFWIYHRLTWLHRFNQSGQMNQSCLVNWIGRINFGPGLFGPILNRTGLPNSHRLRSASFFFRPTNDKSFRRRGGTKTLKGANKKLWSNQTERKDKKTERN